MAASKPIRSAREQREWECARARQRYSDPAHRETRKVVRRKRRAERQAYVDAIKTACGCRRCAWNGPACALDFDHIDGKRVNVSRVVSTIGSVERIDGEIACCVVLCVNCHRVATGERRTPRVVQSRYSLCMAKRRAHFDAIKLGSGCVDCGYKGHAVALDFDHVRGEKSFQISKSLWKYMDELMAEVAKCEVVCARCHRIRTHETRVSGHRRGE